VDVLLFGPVGDGLDEVAMVVGEKLTADINSM